MVTGNGSSSCAESDYGRRPAIWLGQRWKPVRTESSLRRRAVLINFMTAEQYKEFGVPYDLEVLNAAKDGWMNTLHAHGSNIMMEILKDYPVQVFNWHAWETYPSVDEAALESGKCLMGGLNRTDITKDDRNAIHHQIYECFKLMGGCGQILTPGCVIRYPLNEETLKFIRKAKDDVEGEDPSDLRLAETIPCAIG